MKRYNMINRTILAYVILITTGLLLMSAAFALDIDASLHWSKRVELGTPINGVIKSVLVNTGDKVNQGETLVKLDDRNFAAELSKAKARVKDLSEKRKEARRQLDRALQLYDRTVLSDHDLQIAKNNKLAADSEYETAKAELVHAKLNLEYTGIRAPFDAYVIKRNAEVGQTVVSGLKPIVLVIVAAAGEMIARGYIEQNHLNGQIQGHTAEVVVSGSRYDGKVKHVGLEPVKTDKQGIYYEIAVVFNTGERILRAGQQVTIKLP